MGAPHNPLSWYIRPLFILPFCYFAYKKNIWGIVIPLVAVTSSMFWFPAPATPNPQAAAFLAAERQYVTWPVTLGFMIAGESAWAIVAPVTLGTMLCAGVLLFAYRHRERTA